MNFPDLDIVAFLSLSVRSSKGLRGANPPVRTLVDLAALDERALRRMRGIGQTSIMEILAERSMALEDKGFIDNIPRDLIGPLTAGAFPGRKAA